MDKNFILKNKSWYVADSTISTFLAHDAKVVSIYPVLDHISLLFQCALDINVGLISCSGNATIVFSNSWTKIQAENAQKILSGSESKKYCAYINNSYKEFNGDHILVLVRMVNKEYSDEYECKLLDDNQLQDLQDFLNHVGQQDHFDFYDIFEKARTHVQSEASLVKLSDDTKLMLLSYQEIKRITDDFSFKLDHIYQSIAMARRQFHRESRAYVSNLFCVIRYVGRETRVRLKRFPYSAQVVLSNEQARVIDANEAYKNESKPFGMEPSSLFQQQLADESRSISDAIFESGIIEFPIESFGEGRDKSFDESDNDTIDQARRRLEQTFLSGFGTRLMHVPIHVGGVPWAVFFLVFPPEENAEHKWLEISRFYRACVPLLGDGLRRIVRRQFLDELSEVVEQKCKAFLTCKDPIEGTIEAINAKVRALCGFFPYIPPLFSKDCQTKNLNIDINRDGQLYKVGLDWHDKSPFFAFSNSLAHDRLQDNEHELLEYVRAGVQRAQAAYAAAKAARAAFGSALAHDVKNSTNEIISRQYSALDVFRLTRAGGDNPAAWANLVRANIRAMMLNSIAMSVNELFVEDDPLGRLGRRSFPQPNIEAFWLAIFRLLLEMCAISEANEGDAADDSRNFQLVIAPSISALVSFHDHYAAARSLELEYPPDWEIVTPRNDLNDLMRKVFQALMLSSHMKVAMTDYRLGVSLAMLTEIISNIRLNCAQKIGRHKRDVIIAYELKWNDREPIIYLQQMHFEPPLSDWMPSEQLPKGIGRTLSLFGPGPNALNIMTVDVASGSSIRNGITHLHDRGERICAYALRIGLTLLTPEEGGSNG